MGRGCRGKVFGSSCACCVGSCTACVVGSLSLSFFFFHFASLSHLSHACPRQSLWIYARHTPDSTRPSLLRRAGEVFSRLLAVEPHHFDAKVAAALSYQGRWLGDIQALSTTCEPLRALMQERTKSLVCFDVQNSAHITPDALSLFAKESACALFVFLSVKNAHELNGSCAFSSNAVVTADLLTRSHRRGLSHCRVCAQQSAASMCGTLIHVIIIASVIHSLTTTCTAVNLSYGRLSEDTLVTLCRSCPKLEVLILKVRLSCDWLILLTLYSLSVCRARP